MDRAHSLARGGPPPGCPIHPRMDLRSSRRQRQRGIPRPAQPSLRCAGMRGHQGIHLSCPFEPNWRSCPCSAFHVCSHPIRWWRWAWNEGCTTCVAFHGGIFNHAGRDPFTSHGSCTVEQGHPLPVVLFLSSRRMTWDGVDRTTPDRGSAWSMEHAFFAHVHPVRGGRVREKVVHRSALLWRRRVPPFKRSVDPSSRQQCACWTADGANTHLPKARRVGSRRFDVHISACSSVRDEGCTDARATAGATAPVPS